MSRHRYHNSRYDRSDTAGSLRAARVISRDELRLVLLSLIDSTERHGYELIRRIKSLSSGNYAPSSGMVYPALAELEAAGFASHCEGEGGRKLFTATAAGIAEAKAREPEIAELRLRLEGLSLSEPGRLAAVQRALANLDMVLVHALPDGKGQHLDAIVDLIDQAARQIERLGQ